MRAGSASSTPFKIPHTQNTAPVIEFRCLWTADRRRKQKRWQDGRLTFHTFNRRAMVYDERSNFVGDSHWRGDHDFGEGEEFELERGGMLVEVGDCIGKDEQDLSELIDKRVVGRAQRVAARGATSPTTGPPHIRSPDCPAPAFSSHPPRSLTALLGASAGRYGKETIKNTSPFDEKQRLKETKESQSDERPTKRRKQSECSSDKTGYAQGLIGVTLNLSSRPPSTSIRHDPSRVKLANERIRVTSVDSISDQCKHAPTERLVSTEPIKQPRKVSSDVRMREQKQQRLQNGYASKLAGVSLNLSTTRPGPSKNLCESTLPKELTATEARDLPSGFTDPYQFKARDIPCTINKTPKQKTSRRVRSTNEALAVSMCLSPSHPHVSPKSRKQAHRIEADHEIESSVLRNITQQFIPSLKIKPRPPRKMMMLMQRSSSKSSSRKESSNEIDATDDNDRKGVGPSEPAMSPTSIDMLSFCQKQEALIRARLEDAPSNNSQADKLPRWDSQQPPNCILQTAGAQVLLSYPVDARIGHDTTNALLLNEKSCDSNVHYIAAVPKRVRLRANGRDHELQTSLTELTAFKDGFQPSETDLTAATTICPAVVQGRKMVTNESHAMHSPTARCSIIDQTSDILAPVTSVAQISHIANLPQSAKPREMVTCVANSNPPSLKNNAGISDADFAATDRFRAMLLSSGSLNTTDAQQIKLDHSMSSGDAPKAGSSSSDVKMMLLGTNESLARNYSQMHDHSKNKLWQQPHDERIVEEFHALSQSSSKSSATPRTKSSPSCASGNISKPALISQSSLRAAYAESAIKEDITTSRLVDGGSMRGPWSREAFDLFGSWRPPDRASATEP